MYGRKPLINKDQFIAELHAENDQFEALLAAIGPDRMTQPIAPGQWMMIAETGRDGGFARTLAARIAGLGHASDQSQGRVVIRLSGPKARDALAKDCTLDLHPRAAAPGFCAQTVMAEVGVLIHQLDERPSYDLVAFSGFALHLWTRLAECGAEFGVAGFASSPNDGAALP